MPAYLLALTYNFDWQLSPMILCWTLDTTKIYYLVFIPLWHEHETKLFSACWVEVETVTYLTFSREFYAHCIQHFQLLHLMLLCSCCVIKDHILSRSFSELGNIPEKPKATLHAYQRSRKEYKLFKARCIASPTSLEINYGSYSNWKLFSPELAFFMHEQTPIKMAIPAYQAYYKESQTKNKKANVYIFYCLNYRRIYT